MLDLFCGAGGASVGYTRAGFEVTGVDINLQPNYPYWFMRADALGFPLEGYDAYHASPPCQFASTLRHLHPEVEYPNLIGAIRERLLETGRPFIIENVPQAARWMNNPVMLCGSTFGLGASGRQLRRHRLFECHGFTPRTLPCRHEGKAIGVYGGGNRTLSKGAYQADAEEKRIAMGIDWASRDEINEAVPPAYTEMLGGQLMSHLLAQQP